MGDPKNIINGFEMIKLKRAYENRPKMTASEYWSSGSGCAA
jgi:hypothetical protein